MADLLFHGAILVFHLSEKCALFIDGTNLYAVCRSLGFEIDYKALRNYFAQRTNLIRAHYYSALLDSDSEEYKHNPVKPLTDWLAYNGYTLVTKTAREFLDSAGRRRIKGNMDVELAVDLLEMAPRLDHVVLFSGDSDFRYAVEAVQRKGVKVSVVSSLKSSPPTIGDDLRRQADHFIELADIRDAFTRTPGASSK